MRNTTLLACVLVSIAGLALVTGCKKSSTDGPEKEGRITGKRSDPPASLQAQWKSGQRYLMHLETTQSAQWGAGRQAAPQETTTSQDYALTVTNAPDGHRGLEMEIRALTVDSQWGDQNVIRFDSLNKVTPQQGPGVDMLQKAVGGRIRFLLDSDNQVVQVDGIKELMERAQSDAPANPGRGWMTAILERAYNADYFKQMVDVSFLPKSAVRIGDTWVLQKEVEIGLVGTALLRTTNTLRGWQERDRKKCARIEVRGTLGLKPGSAQGLLPFFGMTVTNGTVSGKSWFDPQIGLPIESVLEESCTITGPRPNWGRGRGTNAAASDRFSSPWRQTISVKLLEVELISPGTPP